MRVELVCPAAEDSAHLPSLALAVLAGLTPPGVELALRDDALKRLQPADLDLGADLAAITVSTKTASRGYELARIYRQAGVRVVLGGIHPTAMPDEARGHADAVVVGEAEGLWEHVIADAQRGALRPLYSHPVPPDFAGPVRPRRDLFRSRRYIPVQTVQASRGCPFDCEFCSVTPFFGHELRLRPLPQLVQEIEELDGKWLMFADDNILSRPDHSRRLLRELAPLRRAWFGQASLHGLRDEANLRLLADAGCRALFVGFESVNRASLLSCSKSQNHPEQYLEIVRRLHGHGIAVWASFVFGLDEDEEDVFERTLELAVRSGVIMAVFAMLTPYPGTRLYRRLQQEGRLLEPKWWLAPRRDDFPVFRPRRMTPERLYQGWQSTWRAFYSGGSILRRFVRSPFTSLFSLVSFFPLNLHQHRLASKKILGGEKFFLRDR